MTSFKTLLIVAIGLGVWLAGCDVREPGQAAANMPPTTILSVAPNNGATVNHYIPLRWAGNDPDGTVTGFNLYIDGNLVVTTTARDTFIAFVATSDGVPTEHTFAVQSVDNEGLVDPVLDPERNMRTFSVINFRPTATFDPAESILPNAVVGRGFRVTIAAQDSNPSLTYYSIALDDTNNWLPWSTEPTFIFADPAIIGDTTLFPDHVVAISNEVLTPGAHTLYARVKDAGEAISDVIAIPFTVEDGRRPLMQQNVTGVYGSNDFYPDGSVYYSSAAGTQTQIAFLATAAEYSGEINAYRFRLGEGAWSNWQSEAAIDTVDLPPGDYVFQIMARDIAGALSDTVTYVVRLVQQALTDSIIVVDETRNGTGNPGSPSDIQVDQFYAALLAEFKARSLDYDSNRAGEPLVSYVSPYDIRNAGLVVWHSDDRAQVLWYDNVRLLNDFLGQGGRLLLSGWDVMAPLGIQEGDSAVYSSVSFARTKLRVFAATRQTARRALGIEGVNGYPSAFVDPAKVPPSWNGAMDYAWTFRQRGEATVTGVIIVSDSTSNPLHRRPAAYLYDQSFRVAVYGMPLYFLQQPQVDAIFDLVIPRLLQGLGPAF